MGPSTHEPTKQTAVTDSAAYRFSVCLLSASLSVSVSLTLSLSVSLGLMHQLMERTALLQWFTVNPADGLVDSFSLLLDISLIE